MSIKKIICFIVLSAGLQQVYAQDSSLLSKLDDSMQVDKKTSYVTGTFKAIYIVNMQTVEGEGKGVLNFEIQHRFGEINGPTGGSYNLYGLDNATLRLGFDYGITDRFTVGIGRSSYLKTFDGYLKYKLLRQTAGNNSMPVTISAVGYAAVYTQKSPDDSFLNMSNRMSYSAQLLIARKFSRNISIQLAPTYLHYNLVATKQDKNDVFAIGAGARVKFTKRMSIEAEYNYLPDGQIVSQKTHNSFSFGWGIETGGHVFQLVFSNSQSMSQTQYVAQSIHGVDQSTGDWGDGNIYFGFNISRAFNINKPKPKSPDSN
jgi:opacity protein-like surface antigen